MHPRRVGESGWLAGFFSKLGPAGIEGVVFVLCGIEIEERLLERGCVGCDFGMLDAGAGRGQALVGLLNALLDGGELASFEIGELLSSAGGVCGDYGIEACALSGA
jgi:hypothetical protein